MFKNPDEHKKTLLTRIIIAFSALTIILCIVFISLLGAVDIDDEINQNGKALFGGFTVYQNTIYVVVPGDGYFPVPQADIKSFQPISHAYDDRHMAIDDKNVYCGNSIIPQLDPKKVAPIGNNYYSDGTTTCYCDKAVQRNKDLTVRKGLRNQISHYLFGNDKPQKPQMYRYGLKVLPKSDTPYFTMLKNRSIACNGKQVFYKGEVMPKANKDSLAAIPLYNHTDTTQSFVYFRDGKHVYHQNKLLPITDNKALYGINVNPRENGTYLYDPLDGTVYIDSISFDRKNGPYEVMSKFGSHVNHTLWYSMKGVYYYDTVKKETRRAGDNPFSNKNFKEIAPLVFSNGIETLYIDAFERRHNNKTDKSLDKRYTTINRLVGLETQETWSKLGDVYTFGSVWKHGKQWYYFDSLGESQLVFNTIYKIDNEETVKTLLNRDGIGSSRTIRQLIREEKLTEPKYKELLKATTKYDV